MLCFIEVPKAGASVYFGRFSSLETFFSLFILYRQVVKMKY